MDSIEASLAALRKGVMVLCVDDFERENEGDFIGSAAACTREQMALVVRHSTGIVCAPMSAARARALELPLMCPATADAFRTAFTVSVDARAGTSTGVSAADRCATLHALAAGGAAPGDFHRPGHIFPLLAREAGVLARAGHTEASLDLLTLAGGGPVAFLCEVVSSEHEATGDMARLPELQRLAPRLGLPLVSIADLQRYRYRREALVRAAGAPGCFASLHFPGVEYACQAHAVGGEAAGDGSSSGPSSYTIVFTSSPTRLPAPPLAQAPPPWLAPLRAALHREASSSAAPAQPRPPHTLLHVHCTGDTRSNVPWEAQHGPEKGPAEVQAAAALAPPSAYAAAFPAPAWLPAAPPPLPCDRTSAELAQVVAACCRQGGAVQPAFAPGAWSVGGGGVAALPGVQEEDLASACGAGWPAVGVVLGLPAAALASGLQPLLPRLWEFGVRVTRGLEAAAAEQ